MSPAGKPRLRRLLTALFVVAAVATALAFVYARRAEVSEALARMSVLAILGGVLAGAAATVASMLCWRRLITDLDVSLPVPAAARVFFLGQLGKYLPGSVWPVLAQMELGRTYGVRRAASAAAATLLLVLAAVTGVTLALALLPLTATGVPGGYWWLALAALPLLPLLHPAPQQWLLRTAGRILRRDLVLPRTTVRGTAQAAAWMLVTWGLFGLHLYLLVGSACDCAASYPAALGVFALAWVAGFLVVLAPAGAGVREGVLVLGLASVLSPGGALLVALASRVLLTVADLLLAGGAALAARRQPTPAEAA